MVGGVDLHGGADLRAVADGDRYDVKDYAVEVQEDTLTKADVAAIIAEERRPNFRAVAG